MHKKIEGHHLTEKDKRSIEKAVKKVVRDYGEVLKKLGENKEGQRNYICTEDLTK